MECELLCREIVKPSSPTPSHLRVYSLSFLDHIIFSVYSSIIYFYDDQICYTPTQIAEKSNALRKSLSETLALYYPFAGRLRDSVSVDCNDEGVSFILATIKRTKLSDKLENPTNEFLEPLFADGLQWKKMDVSSSLLAIQVSFFEYGGVAVSLCLSHKIGDACTMTTFMNDWAKANKGTCDDLTSPLFNGSSVFPHGDLPLVPELVVVGSSSPVVCKRFVFDGSQIEALKSMVSQEVQNPTRVEVVSTLIYKCFISTLRSISGSSTGATTALTHSINLRPRVVPPLPENSMGNMGWTFLGTSNTTDDQNSDDICLVGLISKMKEASRSFSDKYAKNLRGPQWPFLISECLKDFADLFSDENQIVCKFSSWCNLGIYEVDFGWGKPTWVTTPCCGFKNSVILMDRKSGDGIEALVNLEEKEMDMFESNPLLLPYLHATHN